MHKLTRKEAENLYEFREVLEVGFLGKAIRNMTEKKQRTFEKAKAEYEDAISSRVDRRLFILDAEFHAAIIDMAGNEVLSARYREICQKIFLRFRTEDLQLARILEIKREHNELYEAISLQDVERAKDLVRHHHKASQRQLFPIIFPGE